MVTQHILSKNWQPVVSFTVYWDVTSCSLVAKQVSEKEGTFQCLKYKFRTEGTVHLSEASHAQQTEDERRHKYT
jgi:hypothetical protein